MPSGPEHDGKRLNSRERKTSNPLDEERAACPGPQHDGKRLTTNPSRPSTAQKVSTRTRQVTFLVPLEVTAFAPHNAVAPPDPVDLPISGRQVSSGRHDCIGHRRRRGELRSTNEGLGTRHRKNTANDESITATNTKTFAAPTPVDGEPHAIAAPSMATARDSPHTEVHKPINTNYNGRLGDRGHQKDRSVQALPTAATRTCAQHRHFEGVPRPIGDLATIDDDHSRLRFAGSNTRSGQPNHDGSRININPGLLHDPLSRGSTDDECPEHPFSRCIPQQTQVPSSTRIHTAVDSVSGGKNPPLHGPVHRSHSHAIRAGTSDISGEGHHVPVRRQPPQNCKDSQPHSSHARSGRTGMSPWLPTIPGSIGRGPRPPQTVIQTHEPQRTVYVSRGGPTPQSGGHRNGQPVQTPHQHLISLGTTQLTPIEQRTYPPALPPTPSWEQHFTPKLYSLARRAKPKADLQHTRLTKIRTRAYPKQDISQIFPIPRKTLLALPLQPANVRTLDLAISAHAAELVNSISTDPKYAFTGHQLMNLQPTPIRFIDDLVADDVLEGIDIHPQQLYGITLIHFIPEKLDTPKQRLRHVSDTLSANLSAPEATVQFRPIDTLAAAIAQLAQAATQELVFIQLDLKTSFFQVGIPSNRRNAFTVLTTINNQLRAYRYKKLPMGYSRSCCIMQHILLGILAHIQSAGTVLLSDAYVDNLLLLVPAHQCHQITTRIQTIASTFQITIGELNIGKSCTHRGIVFDIGNDSLSLAPSLAQKLLRRIDFVHVGLPITKLQTESLLSSITYADSILRITPARPCFHMVHYLRAFGGDQESYTQRVSPALNHEIRNSARWLTASTPLSSWAPIAPTGLSFTDASKMAGAIVRYAPTTTTVSTFSITPKQQPFVISRDELAVLMVALEHNPHDYLYCDNMAAVWAAKKRFSSKINMFGIIKASTADTRRRNIGWISTDHNPGDFPTRHSITDFKPPPLNTIPTQAFTSGRKTPTDKPGLSDRWVTANVRFNSYWKSHHNDRP